MRMEQSINTGLLGHWMPQYDQQFTNNNNNVVNTGNTNRPFFRRKRIVDIETVANIEEARKLLSQGWDFQASYPATLANIPHYILVKKE
jgi:hypothetical protein